MLRSCASSCTIKDIGPQGKGKEKKNRKRKKEWRIPKWMTLRGQSVFVPCLLYFSKEETPSKQEQESKEQGRQTVIWLLYKSEHEWVGVGKGFCVFVCTRGWFCVCVLMLGFECGPEQTESSHLAAILGSPPWPSLSISSATTYPPLVRNIPDCPSDANEPHNCGHMAYKSKEENMLQYVSMGIAFFWIVEIIWVSLAVYVEARHPARGNFSNFIILPGYYFFSTFVRILETSNHNQLKFFSHS